MKYQSGELSAEQVTLIYQGLTLLKSRLREEAGHKGLEVDQEVIDKLNDLQNSFRFESLIQLDTTD